MFPTKLIAGLAAAALGLSLAACGGDPTEGTKSASDTITVGSAAFPENEIIAEIYAQGLEAKGIKIKKKLKIGEREAYYPALQNGEIDLIPDYTGNLLGYVDKGATATSSEDVAGALSDALPKDLKILTPSKAEDKDSLNVTKEFSEKNGVTSIGDLAKLDSVTIGAAPVFAERPYGPAGLKKVYGLKDIKLTKIADGGGPNTVKALLDGKVDAADIYTTTPAIKANNLVTLKDPENLIAAQNVAPLIRTTKASKKVEGALDAISEALTTDDLVAMLAENSGDKKTPAADLAKQWLTDKGLI